MAMETVPDRLGQCQRVAGVFACGCSECPVCGGSHGPLGGIPLLPSEHQQQYVDYTVQVDSIGNPEKIGAGEARLTKNPRDLLIAQRTVIAANTPGTLVNEIVCGQEKNPTNRVARVRISHPWGSMDAYADLRENPDGTHAVISGNLDRTAQRIMRDMYTCGSKRGISADGINGRGRNSVKKRRTEVLLKCIVNHLPFLAPLFGGVPARVSIF